MVNIKKSAFFLLTFFAAYLIYVYPFYVIKYLISGTDIFSISSIIVSLFFYSTILFYFRSKSTFFLFKIIAHEGMGIGFISFWIASLGLLINTFALTNSLNVGVFCILTILLITLISISNGGSIKSKYLKLFSPKIEEQVNLIFISDTHLGSNSKTHLEKIYSRIENINFDLLLIGGDFIDSSSFDLKGLEILKKLNKPILFVSGNHEYYIKNHEKKLSRLSDYGLTFLDNESFKFKGINFIGVSDNQSIGEQKIVTNKLIKKDLFNLVIVHKPSLWEFVYKKTDLMLSGHTHNGQIFPFNFFVRLQFKHIYGLYQKLNSKLYVSSGSGCWGPRMRLGTNNEIIQILISKT